MVNIYKHAFTFWHHAGIELGTWGRSRNFEKGGPVRGQSPELSIEGLWGSGDTPHQQILKN